MIMDTSGSGGSCRRRPGKALEERLIKIYGPENPYFEDFCALCKKGFEEGCLAMHLIAGDASRRGRVDTDPRPFSPSLYSR